MARMPVAAFRSDSTISCARPAVAHDDARAKTLRASADGRENARIARSVRSLSLPRFCPFYPRKLCLDRRPSDADDRDRVGSLRTDAFGYSARIGRARRRGSNRRTLAPGRTSCGSLQPEVDYPVVASRERNLLGLLGAHFLESLAIPRIAASCSGVMICCGDRDRL